MEVLLLMSTVFARKVQPELHFCFAVSGECHNGTVATFQRCRLEQVAGSNGSIRPKSQLEALVPFNSVKSLANGSNGS